MSSLPHVKVLRALILYRRRRFINHLLTYLLTYLLLIQNKTPYQLTIIIIEKKLTKQHANCLFRKYRTHKK